MKSRLVPLGILLACILSLLPVLFVNDALDIAYKVSPGAPVIELTVEDPCNSILEVRMIAAVSREWANLDIKSSMIDQPTTCNATPFALISTRNLQLRMPDGRIVERGYGLKTGPTIARAGTLEKTAGGSSSFAVPLRADSDARYEFASDALNAGFGERALRVQLMARNLTCDVLGAAVQREQPSVASQHCVIPLRAVLQYADADFHVAAAIPPTYYVFTGPDVGEAESTVSYPTTRLLWIEHPTSPSSDIKGTLTGFETRLMDKRSLAQKQFITVAGSAVFGTLVSMLLTFKVWSQFRAVWQAGMEMIPGSAPPPARSHSSQVTTPGESDLLREGGTHEPVGTPEVEPSDPQSRTRATAPIPAPPIAEAQLQKVVAPAHPSPTGERAADPGADISDPRGDTKSG